MWVFTTQTAMKIFGCRAANLPQGTLYPKTEDFYEQKDSCWVKLEAAQPLLLVKPKSRIKSDGTFKKDKTKPDGSFKKKGWSAKDLFKNTWSFCLLWDLKTKYSIYKRHAITVQQLFPQTWLGF